MVEISDARTGRGTRVRTRRAAQKVAALAAFGLVLVAGAGATSLAAWTDTEWVQGGVGDVPGIATSVFQIQQNTTTGEDAWVDKPTSPGGVISFVDAADLTPGETTYGFVRLRTTAASVSGTVTINAGEHAVGDALYDALRYGAGLVSSPADCTIATFGVGSDNLVAFDSELDAILTSSFPIAAAASVEQIVCFSVTLPADSPSSLQGLSTTPEWFFTAESD